MTTPLPALWPKYTVLRISNQQLISLAFAIIAIEAKHEGSGDWNPNPSAYPGGTVFRFEPGGVA